MSDATPDSGQWYLGAADGKRDGPLTLEEIRQRISTRQVTRETLVWKEGMTEWSLAGNVTELFPPEPGRSVPSLPASRKAAENANFMRALDRAFSSPAFFRIVGRICAILAVVVLIASIPLFFTARDYAWFSGAAVLALFFFVGEAAGAILDAIARGKSSHDGEE